MVENITNCLNGELKPGDLVLSTPDDYACLVGTVLSITKAGTPEHESETENETDGVHVNFKDTEYSDNRIREIEEMFTDLYGEPMTYGECPIDDVIMPPDMLIRITNLSSLAINDILQSRERAEIYCGIAMLGISQNADKTTEQPGFITEKLYSPLFVNMIEDDNVEYYDGDYWCDPISQQRAAQYEDKIHESILKERHPDEEERGLMEYYHNDDSVDEKVRSLFVDVEVHDGKLWGVATLELTEPLTQGELSELKEYLTGQYSDGFGEGYEQRGFRVDDGELYVSLWESGDKFFIDSTREFEQRLGIKLPAYEQSSVVPETPEKAPPREPEATPDPIPDGLLEQIAKKHCRFETLETRRSDNLDFHEVSVWGIKAALEEAYHAGLSRQIAQEKSSERTESDPLPAAHEWETPAQELSYRLERNYADMMSSLRDDITRPGLTQQELVNKAGEIAAVDDAHFYMTEHHSFDASEVQYLLQFQNPLEVVADAWKQRTEDISDMSFALNEVFDKQDALRGGYELVPDAPIAAKESGRKPDAAGTPSVLAQIRAAEKAAKERPATKKNHKKDKSGPEH